MLINILIARLTPWKYIFLTGHHTLFMSMMVAVILATAGLEGAVLVAVGSLVVGVSMVFFPAIAHPYMKKITGSDDVALGHFSTISMLYLVLLVVNLAIKRIQRKRDECT